MSISVSGVLYCDTYFIIIVSIDFFYLCVKKSTWNNEMICCDCVKTE